MIDYDEAVALLEADVFDRCAERVAHQLLAGRAIEIRFQPGDATAYKIRVGSCHVATISSNGEDHEHITPTDNMTIAFGTDSSMNQTFVGHMYSIAPDHPWTAAVWRRLCPLIRHHMEAL